MRFLPHIPLLLALAAAPVLADGSVQSLGPLGGSAVSVLIDPNSPSTILVTTYNDALVRSTDSGVTFSAYGNGLPSGSTVTNLQADPGNGSTFYAHVSKQIFRSLDSGANWTALGLNPGYSVNSLAINGSLMLCAAGNEVWRSADAGATWSLVHTGVIFNGMVIAANNPSVAYVGHLNGVDKSIDGGLTWSPTAGFTNWTPAVQVDSTDENIVYAGGKFGGFEKSIDGGLTSFSITSGYSTSSTQWVKFQPGSTTNLIAGCLNGIWRTIDGGTNWFALNQGLGAFPPIPNDLAFSATGAYLATDNGLYLQAGAPPWTQIAFPDVTLYDAAFAGPGGDRLTSSAQGIYAASPGQTLSPSPFFIFGVGMHTDLILVDPSDSTRWIRGGVGAFFDDATITVLTNSGANAAYPYVDFGSGNVRAMAMNSDDPDLMLAGVSPNFFSRPGIVTSNDRGDTWTQTAGTNGWPVVGLAFDPFAGGHAIAYLQDHRWAESTDDGVTWTLMGTWSGASGNGVGFAIDPFAQGVYYRLDSVSGLLRSDDAGASWSNLGTVGGDRIDLAFHPSLPGLLWTTAGDGSVFMSNDRGDNWELLFQTPGGSEASGVAFDATDNAVLVATLGESAWELNDFCPFVDLGGAGIGSGAIAPKHYAGGGLPNIGNASFTLEGSNILGGATVVLAVGSVDPALPIFGGVLHTSAPWIVLSSVTASGSGAGNGTFSYAAALANDPTTVGLKVYSQFASLDAGITLSNGLETTIQP